MKALKKKPSLNELEEMLGSKERVLFYLTWLKHDRNATKAYEELHPGIVGHSASVLGSKMLSNIDVRLIANEYGLNHEKYFEMFKEGLEAEKRDQYSGEMYVDHTTRLKYHDKLGKLLGVEQEQSAPNVQVNVLNKLDTHKKDYNLDE